MNQLLPLAEIGLGVAALIGSLLIHAIAMYLIRRRSVHYRTLPELHVRRELAFSGLVFAMLLTHVVEVFVWAAALVAVGALPNFRDAYYYVAVTYTTLGYASGTLPEAWRILAPMIAMSGVFAFGWTTSVLFAIVSGTDPVAVPAPPQSPAGRA